MKIVLASGNAGKLKELGELLAPHSLELVAQASLGIEPAEETGCTFIENALQKARHASRDSAPTRHCSHGLQQQPGLQRRFLQ